IASLDEILVIVPERIKTKRPSNFNPAKVIELWNQFAHQNKLPHTRAATKGLKKSINNITEKQKWTINNWTIFFYALSISDFLMGKVDDFKLSLDWLVKPANFSEVNAGNYHELFSSKKHTESKKRG
ncbi:MAG: hypothetical protein GY814_10080, partial [Gammaproteobacteria bacterium]|nr:hypothetical protein [Gammaproteobacteria bacterium]